MVQWRKPRAREVSPPRPAAWKATVNQQLGDVTDGDNNTARVNGDNSVAIAGFGVPDPTGYFCAPTRTRTWDLRIKSP